jgi:hypothetical protein
VYEALEGGPVMLEHRYTPYLIQSGPGTAIVATKAGDATVVFAPRFMAPCLLNVGGQIDFAGMRAAVAPVAPWSAPINDIVATVDGAEPQTIRTKALQTWVSFADFDADGDADLMVERSDYLDGPPREVLLRVASSRRHRHTISVYAQEVDGRFSGSPRDLVRTQLQFDAPLANGGRRWMAYRAGGLVATQGDFNGDKRSDLVVWDSPNRIAVYMNHEGLFRRSADFEFTIPDDYERIETVDVDADGKSDIVLVPIAAANAVPKVFFSR